MAYSGPPDSKFFPGGALLICRLLASALIIAIFTPLWGRLEVGHCDCTGVCRCSYVVFKPFRLEQGEEIVELILVKYRVRV